MSAKASSQYLEAKSRPGSHAVRLSAHDEARQPGGPSAALRTGVGAASAVDFPRLIEKIPLKVIRLSELSHAEQ